MEANYKLLLSGFVGRWQVQKQLTTKARRKTKIKDFHFFIMGFFVLSVYFVVMLLNAVHSTIMPIAI